MLETCQDHSQSVTVQQDSGTGSLSTGAFSELVHQKAVHFYITVTEEVYISFLGPVSGSWITTATFASEAQPECQKDCPEAAEGSL